jgi:UDP-N-acetylglucosamine 2-epimerase (non-hydrolysing)
MIVQKNIAVIMGTRPEAIKLAPVVKALEKAADLRPLVVSTGQHRDMLRQVVGVFDVRLDEDLDVMLPGQSLAALSARLLVRIDEWLGKAAPDLVLVQGDTTTVLMAALASFYRQIPVGHVEAGLRTGNIYAPFPEEANRKLASSLTTLHFAPTEAAREHLLREGADDSTILVTGNTVVDALQLEIARQRDPAVRKAIHLRLAGLIGKDWAEVPYVLVTGHRRENFGAGFRQICEGIRQLSEKHGDVRIIYPVHLNPNVRGPVHDLIVGRENVSLVPPQEYADFVALMSHCTVILTDSGGVQEEAPSLGKPVLVMRDVTERPEGVEAGTVRVIGASAERIVDGVSRLLNDREEYERMSRIRNPYGDGRAAGRIVERIRWFFQGAAVDG